MSKWIFIDIQVSDFYLKNSQSELKVFFKKTCNFVISLLSYYIKKN